MAEKLVKKILPIKESLTGAWPEHNFLLSIVSAMDTGIDWIMNHYIQTYGSYYKSSNGVEEIRLTFYPFGNRSLKAGIYDLCPFIYRYLIPRELIQNKYESLFSFIKEYIDKGYYINLAMDQISLAGIHLDEMDPAEVSGERVIAHPVYLYGYDMEKGIIYCADNFNRGVYINREVKIEDFEYSFSHTDLLDYLSEYEVEISLYSMIPYYKHKFKKELLITQLEEYLTPAMKADYLYHYVITPVENCINEVKFGVESYSILIDYLRRKMEDKKRTLDLRSLAYLRDHKKLMCMRVKYLVENGYIEAVPAFIEKFEDLEKQAKRLTNLGLKADMSQSDKYVLQLIDSLQLFREKDEELLRLLVLRLKA